MNQLVVKEDFASKVKRWVLLDSQLKMINENVLKLDYGNGRATL